MLEPLRSAALDARTQEVSPMNTQISDRRSHDRPQRSPERKQQQRERAEAARSDKGFYRPSFQVTVSESEADFVPGYN
jgi:hypothetical protein